MANYGTRMNFRSRKVDNKRQLLILKDRDAPDIDQNGNQRTAVQIETGVEKEEEEEHHLQIAILASQAAYTGGTVASKYIPTPEASKLVPDYDDFYPPNFVLPQPFFLYEEIYEDSIGSNYCLDEIDLSFLQSHTDPLLKKIKENRFEDIMTLLEDAAVDGRIDTREKNPTIPPEIMSSIRASYPKSKSLEVQIPAVFKHWLNRRQNIPFGEPIMPRLKIDRSIKPGNDPYLCFRRREIRLQRRTRATDSFYINRLNQLRENIKISSEIIGYTIKREEINDSLLRLREQIIKLKLTINRKRVQAKFSDPVQSHVPAPVSITHLNVISPKTTDSPQVPVKSTNVQAPKPKPKPRVKRPIGTRKRNEEAGWIDHTDLPYQFPSISNPQKYFCYVPNVSQNHPFQDGISYRRRCGRGGRVYIDRCRLTYPGRQLPTSLSGNEGWLEENVPFQDEYNVSTLRFASRLLSDQDQLKLFPNPPPGTLHQSDNLPLPHGLLEGKLAAALAAQKSSFLAESALEHGLFNPASTDEPRTQEPLSVSQD